MHLYCIYRGESWISRRCVFPLSGMERRELVKLAFQTRLSLLPLCKQQGSLPKPFARVTPHSISASKTSSSGENHDKTNPLTSTQLYTTVDDISTDYDDEIIWKLFAVLTIISPISIHIHPILMYHNVSYATAQ